MAIKSEISWRRRNEDGEKVEVYARRHGGEWAFHERPGRHDAWQPIAHPSLDDWLTLLDAVRRRVPRRLYPPDEVNRIRREIQIRHPGAELPDASD